VKDSEAMLTTPTGEREQAFSALLAQVEKLVDWFDRQLHDWSMQPARDYEETVNRMARIVGGECRAVLRLAVCGRSFLPSALVAGRAAFEGAVTCAWVLLNATDESEVLARWIGLTREEQERFSKFASSSDHGLPNERAWWLVRNQRRTLEFALYTETLQLGREPIARPTVAAMLEKFGLTRLYYSYMIASQFNHGDLMAAEEFYSSPARNEELEPDTEDWTAALYVVAWSIRFTSHAYNERPRASTTELSDDPFDTTLAAIREYGARYGESNPSASS
jgi:hypothetical protein